MSFVTHYSRPIISVSICFVYLYQFCLVFSCFVLFFFFACLARNVSHSFLLSLFTSVYFLVLSFVLSVYCFPSSFSIFDHATNISFNIGYLNSTVTLLFFFSSSLFSLFHLLFFISSSSFSLLLFLDHK